jgi:hypothetical protein
MRKETERKSEELNEAVKEKCHNEDMNERNALTASTVTCLSIIECSRSWLTFSREYRIE